MTPRMRDSGARRLNVPELSGGVNYRDGISQVADNQLTDCRNVWYTNGLLQTRPGIRCATDYNDVAADILSAEANEHRHVYMKKENLRIENGITYFLVVIQTADKLEFRYYYDAGHYYTVGVTYDVPAWEYSCNVFVFNNDVYCFCSGYDEALIGADTAYYIFKVCESADKTGEWYERMEVIRITDDDLYAPLIMINCGPHMQIQQSQSEMVRDGAVMLEGYNLLGTRYRMWFSTASEYSSTGTDTMWYTLLHDVRTCGKDRRVTAVITDSNGVTTTHTVDASSDGENLEQHGSEAPADGLTMAVKGYQLYFYDYETGELATVSREKFIANNMEVNAPVRNDGSNFAKVLNMTFGEWYGGDSNGLYGGVHLFLGGNSLEEEKALICWSDFNRPLYFSENCYAYVGDKSQRVTAFGRQGESLIILKERETYATEYTSADEVTEADALIDGSVVDIAAGEAVFPLVQVHGFIGCDCPQSVQLCRNRLVWLHSDGRIYTLVSASQYNERSIYEVSAMVQNRLKRHSAAELRGALSADWQGHYILSLGDSFYVMSYNSYGYANIASYSKTEDAQLRIPWWIWEKPKYDYITYSEETKTYATDEVYATANAMIAVGDQLYISADFGTSLQSGESKWITVLMTVEGEKDLMPVFQYGSNGNVFYDVHEVHNADIPAMMQTKLFDFGDPTVKKSVPKAEISFGSNGGVPITVTTVTDRGECESVVLQNGEETDDRKPGFFKNRVIRSRERPVCRVGYRLESTGSLFVDSVSMFYKRLE